MYVHYCVTYTASGEHSFSDIVGCLVPFTVAVRLMSYSGQDV